jgi:hypothetical protein
MPRIQMAAGGRQQTTPQLLGEKQGGGMTAQTHHLLGEGDMTALMHRHPDELQEQQHQDGTTAQTSHHQGEGGMTALTPHPPGDQQLVEQHDTSAGNRMPHLHVEPDTIAQMHHHLAVVVDMTALMHHRLGAQQ